ncbi:MAG TPA: beta-ketoacyl synthase N-terminal-like domain-containing protein [Streptosporangiaceae bacterium]|jgi:3-oxoacyl-(acyl-carrier-protein) synthase
MANQQPPAAGRGQVVITGLGVTSAYGRGTAPLLAGVLSGKPAFAPVTRFGTERCRVKVAAQLPGAPVLADEITAAVQDACAAAGLDAGQRAGCELLVALHSDAAAARDATAGSAVGDTAATVASRCGFPAAARVYAAACVAASTAVADAASMIVTGQAGRVTVAAGFLVDSDSLSLFDAGRALAADGQVRPFSTGRRGMLLGDGVAAVVLESAAAAASRGARPLAVLAGWGRAGDAYHVVQPRPDGSGMARAITSALRRAGLSPADIGYVNANGTGTSFSDSAEAAALHRALGAAAGLVPVSSTKSVHGHALEASALLELVVAVLVLGAGRLPVNAGYLGPDPDCQLDLVLTSRQASPGYALSLNAAFGGANTALLVGAA